MKSLITLFITLCLAGPNLLGAGQESVEALMQALRQGIDGKDAAAIRSLYYPEGMTGEDLAMVEVPFQSVFTAGQTVADIKAAPLPPNLPKLVVARGRKVEPNAEPQGVLAVTLNHVGMGSNALSLQYTEVDGKFYLVGMKVTDLNWQGPPDKSLSYMVTGPGQENIRVLVKWNASGVDLEEEMKSPSATILGQHIDAITVTSTDPQADLTLTLREKREVIHTSAPLKGSGQIEYRRP